jgi:hypothetical protein
VERAILQETMKNFNIPAHLKARNSVFYSVIEGSEPELTLKISGKGLLLLHKKWDF